MEKRRREEGESHRLKLEAGEKKQKQKSPTHFKERIGQKSNREFRFGRRGFVCRKS